MAGGVVILLIEDDVGGPNECNPGASIEDYGDAEPRHRLGHPHPHDMAILAGHPAEENNRVEQEDGVRNHPDNHQPDRIDAAEVIDAVKVVDLVRNHAAGHQDDAESDRRDAALDREAAAALGAVYIFFTH